MDHTQRVPPSSQRCEERSDAARHSSHTSEAAGGSGSSNPPSAPTSSLPSLSSERLLRVIEETSDLLRSFRLLKERGASRRELAALHARVCRLKEAQMREAAGPLPTTPAPLTPPPALSSVPSCASRATPHVDHTNGCFTTGLRPALAHPSSVADSRSARQHEAATAHHPHRHRTHHVDPHSNEVRPSSSPARIHGYREALPERNVWGRHTTAMTATSATSPRVNDARMTTLVGSANGAVDAVVQAPLSSTALYPAPQGSVAPPLHSVIFAVALAESHMRLEIAHKWKRRLLRYWANFKEKRVAIALRPSAAHWVEDDNAGDIGSRAAYATLAIPDRSTVKAPPAQDRGVTAVVYSGLPSGVKPQSKSEVPGAKLALPTAAVSQPTAGGVQHMVPVPAPVPAVPPNEVKGIQIPLAVVGPPLSMHAAPGSSAPPPPPEPSVVPSPLLTTSVDNAATRDTQECAQPDRAAIRQKAMQEATEESPRTPAGDECRGLPIEQQRAASLSAEQEAAEAQVKRLKAEDAALPIKAEHDAAVVRRSAEDAEADARHAVEAAESGARGQLEQEAGDSHANAAAAELARVEAEREAAQSEARRAAVRQAAREQLEREQHTARLAVEGEGTAAYAQLLSHAADAERLAEMAAEKREAYEREELASAERRRAAAVKAAQELHEQQARAQLLSSCERLTNLLIDEWMSDAAVLTASNAAEQERELAARVKAAEAEAARIKAEHDAAVARRSAEDAEADARHAVEAAENVSLSVLDEWLHDAAAVHTELAGAANRQRGADLRQTEEKEAAHVKARERGELKRAEGAELEDRDMLVVEGVPQQRADEGTPVKGAADSLQVGETRSATSTPLLTPSSTAALSASSALLARLSASGVLVEFADDMLAHIIHEAADALIERRVGGETGLTEKQAVALATSKDGSERRAVGGLGASVKEQSAHDDAAASTSARTSPSNASSTSPASTLALLPPQAAAAVAAVTHTQVFPQYEDADWGGGETEQEASVGVGIASPQQQPRTSSSFTSNNADEAVSNAATSRSAEASLKPTEATIHASNSTVFPSADPHEQPWQAQQLANSAQPEALQPVTAVDTPFSPLSLLSTATSAGEYEGEPSSLATQGVRQPLNLTPPPSRGLSPLFASVGNAPLSSAIVAGADQGTEAEERTLFLDTSRDDWAEALPHRPADAPRNQHDNPDGDLLNTASRPSSTSEGGEGEGSTSTAAIAVGWAASRLGASQTSAASAVTALHEGQAFTVGALEAASGNMTALLIRDAVRLLPANDGHHASAPLCPTKGSNHSNGLTGERHLSPSLSPERLDRVRQPSPAPSQTLLSTDAKEGNEKPAVTRSSSSSSNSSISELRPGFAKSDTQEALPLPPSSAPSPTALVGAPAVAPGITSGEARTDLASLTTLVTAVATPNDFIEQLRQQDAEKKAAAYQQSRYLSHREISLVVAEYLTSEVVAAQVQELGPPEALTASAIALVLSVGLVRRVTVANRRARRRVAAPMNGLARPGEPSAETRAAAGEPGKHAPAGIADASGPLVQRQSHNLIDAFPTSADADDNSASDTDLPPSSPSLGRHGFGGAVGDFAAGQEGDGDGFPTGAAALAAREGSGGVPSTSPLPPDGSAGAAAAAAVDAEKAADDPAKRKLPPEWSAGLRGVAERVACDFMDYASRRVLLGQGEGQSNQDRLRTTEEVLRDALSTVNIHAMFTQELRAHDVARLTVYYLDLAMDGAGDRPDPHYAPAALGEHNIFGRRSSGDVDEKDGFVSSPSFPPTPPAETGRTFAMGGGNLVNSNASPTSVSGPSALSPKLHPRNETFLTAATAIHTRRAGLMQQVLEQCVSNVMNDLIGDTVGWLSTTFLQPAACSAGVSRP